MKRIYILLLFMLTSMLALNAQFSISYSAGMGQYKMNEMKGLARYIVQQAPLDMKLTDNFPIYVNHSIDLAYKFQQHEVGIKGTYMTTGATMAYSDYSGKEKAKIITNGYRLGAMYRFHFYEADLGKHSYSLFAEVSPGITFSKFKLEDEIIIYGDDKTETKTDKESFETVNGFTIQPLVGIRFKLYDHILLNLSTGYDFEFGAKYASGARVDWSGFRLNAGVGYSF